MMTDQTKIGQSLRAIMSGRAGQRQDLIGRFAQRLVRWQQLARKYHGVGLSTRELEDFWQEIHQQRTNVDLILEISVRTSDWQQVGREVKAFIDELTMEMALAQSQTAAPGAIIAEEDSREEVNEQEENTSDSKENQYRKLFKKRLVAQYGLGERTKLVRELAGVLALAQIRQEGPGVPETSSAITTPGDPAALLAYLHDYVETLEDDAARQQVPAGWRVRFLGQ